MSNRFNSFKKGISKVKNISPKINRKKNNSDIKRSKSTIEYIVPENSPLRKNSIDSDLDSDFSDYLDGLPEGVSYTRLPNNSDNLDSGDCGDGGHDAFNQEDLDFVDCGDGGHDAFNQEDLDLDGVDKRYAKYIFGDNLSDENYKNPRDSNYFGDNLSDENFKNPGDSNYFGDNLNDENYKNPRDSNYMGDLDNNGGLNSDLRRDRNFHKFDGNYNNYNNFNNDLDNNDENYKNNSCLDEDYSPFSFNNDFDDDYSMREFNRDNLSNKIDSTKSKDIKTKLLNFKRDLLNKDDDSKNRFGKIVFVLIFLVLASSLFYFFVYQPFQDELNLEKNSKLNELNTLYKGPLEAHEDAYILKNQIESENDIEELKKIDILMYATKDWRSYHKSKIVSSKDKFGRVMLIYGDENKNLMMSVKDANEFVKDNDGKILSNIQFGKVDTTIVPISISRLQATAGLISVGSIVDIYSLKDNYSYGDGEDLSDVNSASSINESGENQSLDGGNSDLGEGYSGLDSEGDSSNYGGASDLGSETGSSYYGEDGLSIKGDSYFSQNSEPDVSGATVLAILRSKDSGVIDSSISRSKTLIEGNQTNPYENTSSYSNDVEELLKASVFNSYENNQALESYLDSYGIKLSNYERMSNLADLDSEYLVLLEVPRSDVSFVINNMDNLILTIPTEFAPNWVLGELNEAYYENIYSYDLNSSSFP